MVEMSPPVVTPILPSNAEQPAPKAASPPGKTALPGAIDLSEPSTSAPPETVTEVPTVDDSSALAPTQPSGEAADTPEKPLKDRVIEAWGGKDGANDLIIQAKKRGEYQVGDRDAIAADLGIQADDPDRTAKINAEIEWRKGILAAVSELEAIYSAKNKKKIGPGEFEIGENGTSRIVRTHSTIKPFLNALDRMAKQQSTDPELQESLSMRARRAQKIIDTVQPTLKVDRHGFYFDVKTPDQAKTDESAAKKELENPGEFLLDTAASAVEEWARTRTTKSGEPIIIYEEKDGKKTFVRINEKAIKEIETDEPMGRVTILLGTYQDAPPEAQIYLQALIFDELQYNIDSAKLPGTQDKLKQLKDNGKYFTDILEDMEHDLRENWLRSAGIDDKTHVNMRYILRDLFLAHAIEGDDLPIEGNRYVLPKGANKIFENWNGTTPNERDLIIALSKKGFASSFLKGRLGFDLEMLESNQAANHYATQTVEFINGRRETPLTDPEKSAYIKVLQYNLEKTHKDLEEDLNKRGINFKRRLGIALLLLGMFGGNIQKGLDEGDVKGQQGAPSD